MRRAVLVALVLPIAFGGCTNPRNPTVAAVYVPGQKLASRTIRYDAIVELHARDQPTSGPITATGVPGGTRVGFRKSTEGSVVAFVGERVVPIPDGHCEWIIVSSSWPRWWSRRAQDAERAARLTGEVLAVTAIGIGIAGLAAAFAVAESNATAQ
jgi:hypothetical protein